MHLCFIDEAGDTQLLTSTTCGHQPLLVICGLLIDANSVEPLTNELIALKLKHFPGRYTSTTHKLDVLIDEIKGEKLRYQIRTNNISGSIVKNCFLYIDGIFDLIKKYEIKIVGRIWVKEIGRVLDPRAVYTITIQGIAQRFERYLAKNNAEGLIIADFRDTTQNSYVAHSIFTQKFKRSGDAYPRIRETAVFGISKNHACLQIADIICSTILYPSAARTYCHPTITGVHTHVSYSAIKYRYRRRLMHAQFHYTEYMQTFRGLSVQDGIGDRNMQALFKD